MGTEANESELWVHYGCLALGQGHHSNELHERSCWRCVCVRVCVCEGGRGSLWEGQTREVSEVCVLEGWGGGVAEGGQANVGRGFTPGRRAGGGEGKVGTCGWLR